MQTLCRVLGGSPRNQLEAWSYACPYLVAAKVQPSLDSLTHDNWRRPPRRHPKVASSRPGCCENPILCGSVMGNRSANFKGGGPLLRASSCWDKQTARPDEWETWNPATRPASARWPPISSAPAAGFSSPLMQIAGAMFYQFLVRDGGRSCTLLVPLRVSTAPTLLR